MTGRIVGYQIIGPDNGGWWYTHAPATTFCATCRCVIDDRYVPTRLDTRLPRGSLTYTYDGKAIADQAFRDILLGLEVAGALFQPVGSSEAVFELRAANRVQFDALKRNTSFSAACPECNQCDEVVGATPGFLKGLLEPLPGRELYETDVFFGRAEAKHPLLIVGPGLRDLLRAAGVRRVDFLPMYGESTPARC